MKNKNMIEVVRGSVQTWECDAMGHMNVQFYLQKASHGLNALAVHLGYGPRQQREDGVRLVPLDHHMRFLREQRPGAPFFFRAGVMGAREDGLTVYSEMVSTVTNEPAFALTAEVALVDDMTRDRRSLPPQMLEKAEGSYVERPDYGGPRGLVLNPPGAGMTLDSPNVERMIATYQGMVEAAQCDSSGHLKPRFFLGAVSDAIPNLLAEVRGEDRSQSGKIGGAALEYRLVYRRWPKPGDIIAIRSGLKGLGNKTHTWAHWLFDLESGEAIAAAEAVAVAMDLEKRKAMAIPDEMRARYESYLIPGLGV